MLEKVDVVYQSVCKGSLNMFPVLKTSKKFLICVQVYYNICIMYGNGCRGI